MRKTSIFIVLALVLTLWATPVYAADIPPLPHAFYGDVNINDSPVPAGTIVEAKVEGVQTGTYNPITVTERGKYGSADPLGAKLIVQGDILEGATITFYVTNANGTAIGGTATFASGETTKLDLSATITVPPAPTPTPTQPGGGGVLPTIVTNFFGAAGSIQINSAGIVQQTFTATSPDGNLTITIPAGTKCLDKDGNPLTSLTCTAVSPPVPPENANIIGLAYSFLPAGATFFPPIKFEFTVSPDDITPPLTVDDLVGAYYDETSTPPGWVDLPTSVVPGTTYVLQVLVSHTTTFAIIGTLKPAAFTLSSLVISPAQVAPGVKVDISMTVANTGGLEGSYTVVLKINGVMEAEKSVTVAAGGTQTVSFSVTKANAGSYNVAVDGLSGSFTVVAPAPTTPAPTTPAPTTPAPTTPAPTTPAPTTPAPTTPVEEPMPAYWWYIIGIGVVIVIGVIIFLVRRKRD